MHISAESFAGLENLGFSKMCECVGLMSSLPAYSPDLNPIEKMWSKVKALLRNAEAQTPEELVSAIGNALAKVTAKNSIICFFSFRYRFC